MKLLKETALNTIFDKSNHNYIYKNENEINYDIDTKSLNINNNQENNIFNKIMENPPYYLTYFFNTIFSLYNYDKDNQIITLLRKGPPNNFRWFIWISMAKNKYYLIQRDIGINNNELFDKILKKVDENEKNEELDKNYIKNFLKNENKLNEHLTLDNYIKLLKCLKYYHKNIPINKYLYNILLYPLIVSDYDIKNTFYFFRYFFSYNYGLGLYNFFTKNNDLINAISYISINIIRNKNKTLYEHILSLNLKNDEWINIWIISFYSYILNLDITIRLWDCIIAYGIKFIIFYNIGFIFYFENNIKTFNQKKNFLEFFEGLRNKYKTEEILIIREKFIENALKESFEDDVLKFHIINFIQHFKIRKKSSVDNKESDDTDMEDYIIKEKENLKTKLFNLFKINKDNEETEDNYEIEILNDFTNKKGNIHYVKKNGKNKNENINNEKLKRNKKVIINDDKNNIDKNDTSSNMDKLDKISTGENIGNSIKIDEFNFNFEMLKEQKPKKY